MAWAFHQLTISLFKSSHQKMRWSNSNSQFYLTRYISNSPDRVMENRYIDRSQKQLQTHSSLPVHCQDELKQHLTQNPEAWQAQRLYFHIGRNLLPHSAARHTIKMRTVNHHKPSGLTKLDINLPPSISRHLK